MVSDFRHNLKLTKEPELECKALIEAEKEHAIKSTDAPLDDKNANTKR